MPDVGVLNLQIHDDSAKAAEGLNRLATALKRVQTAIGNGIKLSGIANNIKRINDALKTAIPEESIKSLERLADAVDRLSALNGIDLKGLKNLTKGLDLDGKGGKGLAGGVESIGMAFEAVEQRIEEVYDRMERFSGQAKSTNQIIQSMAWSAGDMADQFERAFAAWNNMRMGSALGSGDRIGIGAGPSSETGWQYYNPYGTSAETGWTEWKDGAIEVEGTVTDAMEQSQMKIEGTRQLLLEAGKATETFTESVKQGAKVWKQFNPLTGQFEEMTKEQMDASSYSNYMKQIAENDARHMEEVKEKIRGEFMWSSDAAKGTVAHIYGMNKEDIWPSQAAEEVEKTASAMNDVGAQSESLRSRLSSLRTSAVERLRDEFSNLRAGIGNMTAPITNLLSQFGRIARYRMLRAVLKQITSGIKEGIENYYRYSQAINSDFAPAMDSAATSLQTMKNSIGAAAAPLIQSLIPYLQQVVNWFISLMNYANQFVSLLRGQSSWSRATNKSAKAFDDVKKSANGASNAVKDLLADWDELNIIQSDSSDSNSGKGASAMTDALGMFEEVSKFDTGLQSLIKNIKEQFGSVWELIKQIGTAILGWKFSEAFTGILGTIGGLVSAGAIIGLVFKLSMVFDNTYFDTKNAGWLVADTLTTLLGAVLAKKVLGKVLGGALANIAIPLTFAVSALGSIKALVERTDVSALSEEGILSALNTALKGGIAAGSALYLLGGYAAGTSTVAGIGAAAFTFGMTVGIKAISDTVDAGAITSDVLKADLLSAATIGTGLAIAEAALGGTIGTIVTVGTGGALFALGALLAIEYVISKQPKRVSWGNYNATKEEIQAFVQSTVFRVNANTVLSLVNPKIDVVTEKEQELSTSVDEVKLTVKKLELGFDTDNTLSELEKQIFGDSESGTVGLIDRFKETAKAKQTLIETGLALVPSEDATSIVDTTSKGWEMLNGHMTSLGQELATHLSNAYKTGIDAETKAMELKTVADLTTMMANVSAAISRGEATETALATLTENIGNMSSVSWSELVKYVNEYKEEVGKAYRTTEQAVLVQIAGQAEALKTAMENALTLAGGDETNAEYQAYKTQYEETKALLESRREGLEAAVKEAEDNAVNQDTMAYIRRILLKMIDPLTNTADVKTAIYSALPTERVAGPEFVNTLWTWLFNEDGSAREGASEDFKSWLNNLIYGTFGADAQSIIDMIDNGFLGYGDVIQQEVLQQIADTIWPKGEGMVQKLYDLLGISMPEKLEVDGPEVDMNVDTNLKTGRKPVTSLGIVASAGAGGYGFGGRYTTSTDGNGNTELVVKQDNTEQKNNIQNGVREGTGNLLSTLQSIQRVAEAINRKDFTVNVTPSAAFGRTVQRSGRSYSAQTGESYSLT